MRYQVSLGDQEFELELSSSEPGRYLARVLSGPNPRELEVTVLSDRPTLAVLIEGRVVELFPLGAGAASARNARTPARLIDPAQARRARQARSAGSSAGAIVAPMPGRIVKVMVAQGDAVSAGQPALVIEAMKMENELVCTQSGQVQKVLVKAGDAVERGAVLIEID